jgi:hypothetical protein
MFASPTRPRSLLPTYLLHPRRTRQVFKACSSPKSTHLAAHASGLHSALVLLRTPPRIARRHRPANGRPASPARRLPVRVRASESEEPAVLTLALQIELARDGKSDDLTTRAQSSSVRPSAVLLPLLRFPQLLSTQFASPALQKDGAGAARLRSRSALGRRTPSKSPRSVSDASETWPVEGKVNQTLPQLNTLHVRLPLVFPRHIV